MCFFSSREHWEYLIFAKLSSAYRAEFKSFDGCHNTFVTKEMPTHGGHQLTAVLPYMLNVVEAYLTIDVVV